MPQITLNPAPNAPGKRGTGPFVVPTSQASPPNTTNDTATATASGSAINIDVLANDNDPEEGGTLSIDGTPTHTGGGTVAVLVSDGSVTDTATGTTIPADREYVSYTPGASAETDVITYRALSSASNLTAEGRVDVTVQSAGGGDFAVAITASRVTGTAPAGFMFEATATGFSVDDPKRDLRYKWNFGDPTSPDFTAPGPRFDATVNGRSLDWRNSNIAYTFRGTHTFHPSAADFADANGSYKEFTVTCTVQDRTGNVAIGSTTVRVNNPANVFSTTVGVDPATELAALQAEYPEASAVYATYAEAYGAGGASKRILLRGGNSYETTGIRNDDRIQVGAYDLGAGKPKFDIIAGGPLVIRPSGIIECCLWGIEFEGDWNIDTEASPTISGSGQPRGIDIWNEGTSCEFTLHDLVFSGMNFTSMDQRGKPHKNPDWSPNFYITNYRVNSYRGYGLLGNGGLWNGFAGFAVLEPPTKQQGLDPNKGTDRHDHGPIRLTIAKEGSKWCFDAMDLQSWAGWSNDGGSLDYTEVPSPQSGLRFNPGSSPDVDILYRWAVDWTVSRYAGEGGRPNLLGAFADVYARGNVNIVFDKIIIVGTADTPRAMDVPDYGVEVTNVFFIVPRFARSIKGSGGYAAPISLPGSTPSQSTVRGCTVLNWNDPDLVGGTPTAYLSFEAGGVYSSIFHCPWNLGGGDDLSANLNFSEKMFDALYPGLHFIDQNNYNGQGVMAQITDTRYASLNTFNVGGTDYTSCVMPIPVEGQLTTTKVDAPIDDIFGEIRPATPHQGCVEPSSVPV